MKSLDIIQAEHRSMWRVSTALDTLADQLLAPNPAEAATAVVAMLGYLDDFADRLHHPKEDDYLFRLLRTRTPDGDADLAQLESEHRSVPAVLQRLLAQAEKVAAGNDQLGLAAGLHGYAEQLRAHIRLEERSILPLARRMLLPEDWAEIDAAFLAHDDPLFGAAPQAEFAALRARLVQLTPAPLGLGGDAATAAPAVAPLPPQPAPLGAKVLEVRGLASHYGRIQALDGIDLDVHEGQLVALVGANGAGKTTLLRTLSGVQPASAGHISYKGQRIERSRPEARVRAGICQVPEGRQVFGPLSIEDNLRLGAYTRPRSELAEDMDKAYALFPILKEKRHLPAGTLSGGQQQMLAMARALMGRPRLLLLDEPSMGLAPLLIEEIFRVVKTLKGQGITILLVEQNAHAALSIADIGYVLETGRISLSGPGQELLRNERVREAYLGM